jgi:hypothetical protein
MRSAAIRARNFVHASRTPAASGFMARVILGDVIFRADRATGVGGFAPFRNVAVLLATGALGVVSEFEVLFDLAVPAADGTPGRRGSGLRVLRDPREARPWLRRH